MTGAAIIRKLGSVDFYINSKGVIVWNDVNIPKPSQTDIDLWITEFNQEKIDNQWIEDRKKAYDAAGLTFDRWAELGIEGDTAGMADYITRRDAIRASIPKTVG